MLARTKSPGLLQTAYVAVLLAALAALQVHAEIGQFAAGFRPFVHAPSRVAYSWDMFAIRMNRCAVRWDPPLTIDGQRVASWRDRVWPIEFDSVYNDVRSYEIVSTAACKYRSAEATRVVLQCFLSDGGVDEHSLDCP